MGQKMDALIKELNRENKSNLFSKGVSEFEYAKIPLTSPRVNYCTYGGIPIGKMIELYGPQHGGKSTMGMDVVKNFQIMEKQRAKKDKNYTARSAFWADIENTFDETWARKIGVDVDSLYMYRPEAESAEQIFNFVTSVIETGEVGLVVIDSLAAMVSQDEYDKDYDEKAYAGISGPLSRFSKKGEMLCRKFNCTLIGINQVRDDMNSTWGGYKTPGGRAWQHLVIARFEFRKGSYIDENGKDLPNNCGNPYGCKISFLMTKNKTCPPDRRTGFFTINFHNGINYLADLVDMCINSLEIIEKSGSWFTVPGVDKPIQGQDKVYKYLEEHPDVLKNIEKMIADKIRQ